MTRGEAVAIISVDEVSQKLVLHEEKLQAILSSDDCCKFPVAIISVAGNCRTGKSFLMNYIMRRLSWNPSSQEEKWQPDENQPLDGFEWRHSLDGVTAGMMMWSKPFVVDNAHGDKVAVLLVDTEGGDDPDKDAKLYSHLITLSTLLSSTQILNIKEKITASNLDCLQLVLEYGQAARALTSGESMGPVFQELVLLVRDWYYGDYGLVQETQRLTELCGKSTIINDAASAFCDVSCFLLPSPGQEAKKSTFDGRISDCNADFRHQLVTFVNRIVDNVPSKVLNKMPMNGSQIALYFTTFFNLFRSEMPSPLSVMEAASMLQMGQLLRKCKSEFTAEVRSLLKDASTDVTSMENLKDYTMASIMKTFESEYKIGSISKICEKKEELIMDLQSLFQSLLDEECHIRRLESHARSVLIQELMKDFGEEVGRDLSDDPEASQQRVEEVCDIHFAECIRRYEAQAKGSHADVAADLAKLIKMKSASSHEQLVQHQVRQEEFHAVSKKLMSAITSRHVRELSGLMNTCQTKAEFSKRDMEIRKRHLDSCESSEVCFIIKSSQSRRKFANDLQKQLIDASVQLKKQHDERLFLAEQERKLEAMRRQEAAKAERLRQLQLQQERDARLAEQERQRIQQEFYERQRREQQEHDARMAEQQWRVNEQEYENQRKRKQLENERQRNQYRSGRWCVAHQCYH